MGQAGVGRLVGMDARLTTTAMLFFLYLGYLALRRIGGSPHQRSMRSAIAALIAFIDVPIVHFSVTWWTTLHQDGSIFNQKMQVHIQDARMNAALSSVSWRRRSSTRRSASRGCACSRSKKTWIERAAARYRGTPRERRDTSASAPAPQPVATGSNA